jgi:hypothetical protein
MDGTLVSRNEQGHLTEPMLFLDREPVPEDAQDWDCVLVFVDGKTRSTITPTTLVLFEENEYFQSLHIQTGGEWSISDVDHSLIRVTSASGTDSTGTDRTGTGNAQINVTKAPSFNELGFHLSSFTISIAGAAVSETSIQVFLFMGGGSVGMSDVSPTTIRLTEANNFSQTLTIQSDEEWLIAGVDTERIQIDSGSMQGVGNAQIEVKKAESLTTSGDYASAFAVLFPGTAGSAVILVEIVISIPLAVRYNSTTAKHGETLTVNLTAPNYSPQYLYITRDRAWSLEGVESSKITVSPTSGNGSTYEWDSESVSISKPQGLTVEGLITTTFRVVSFTQYVDVIVNIVPQITGEFVDPRTGEVGATGTAPVYIYI